LTAALALERLQRELGYAFGSDGLLGQALTHRSAGGQHNERLEFLGDAVLGFEISRYLYERFPEADEGQLTRMRAQLVKRETLAQAARELGLGDYLTLGAGELRTGGQSRDSTLADALEALIAAVYLDGGTDPARALIHRLLAARLEGVSPAAQRKDAKTRLQEFLQARQLALPSYSVIDVGGEPHAQTFVVRCEVADQQLHTDGSGRSRRRAEQDAASRMLGLLGEH
jgi:ribonuclease-3